MKSTKYIPGDPWFICDICGFQRRRSEIRENWKKQKVCADTCWEPKHPQLTIRPVQEHTAVLGARPDSATYLLNTSSTTLASAAAKGDLTITVASATGITDGDYIAVVTDDGTQVWTTVNGTPVGAVVTLTLGVMDIAASGNTVYFTSSLGNVSADDL